MSIMHGDDIGRAKARRFVRASYAGMALAAVVGALVLRHSGVALGFTAESADGASLGLALLGAANLGILSIWEQVFGDD